MLLECTQNFRDRRPEVDELVSGIKTWLRRENSFHFFILRWSDSLVEQRYPSYKIFFNVLWFQFKASTTCFTSAWRCTFLQSMKSIGIEKRTSEDDSLVRWINSWIFPTAFFLYKGDQFKLRMVRTSTLICTRTGKRGLIPLGHWTVLINRTFQIFW